MRGWRALPHDEDVSVAEGFVAGGDDRFALLEAFDHFNKLGILSANLDVAAPGESVVADHVDPGPAGGLEETTARDEEGVGGIRHLEAEANGLATPDAIRNVADKVEVNLKSPVLYFWDTPGVRPVDTLRRQPEA